MLGFVDRYYLCHMLVIRQIGLNNMYGVARFTVQTVRATAIDFK
jgi:hypothetical protein